MSSNAAVLLLVLVILAVAGGSLFVIHNYPVEVERYQTLITGVYAIVAACVAFFGAVCAARIEAHSIQEDRRIRTETEAQEVKQQHRERMHAFAVAIRAASPTLKARIERNVDSARYYSQLETRRADYVLEMIGTIKVVMPDVFLSKWSDILLMQDQKIMNKILELTSEVYRINNLVKTIIDSYRMRSSGVSMEFTELLARPFFYLSHDLDKALKLLMDMQNDLEAYIRKQGFQVENS